MAVSASGLFRVARCPAAVLFPQVDSEDPDAKRGTTGHRYLQRAAQIGPERALLEAPEDHRARLSDIALEGLPIGEEYRQEVAFAYDLETEGGRELGEGLERRYQTRDGEIPGTADVVHRGPAVEIWDYKFDGFETRAAPPAVNHQLRLLALAACRASGADGAQVGLIHIRPDGTHWEETATLDAFDLDAFDLELREILGRVDETRAMMARGLVPDVTRGPWCRYCGAVPSCPAVLDLVRATAGDAAGVLAMSPIPGETLVTAEGIALALTPSVASRAYSRMRDFEAALKVAKSALWQYACEHPFEVGDGWAYGPARKETKEISGEVARRELAKMHGPEVAEAACEFSTSEAAIERALRSVWEAERRDYDAARSRGEKPVRPTLAGLKRSALEAIAAAGGVRRESKVRVEEFRIGGAAQILAPEVETRPSELADGHS